MLWPVAQRLPQSDALETFGGGAVILGIGTTLLVAQFAHIWTSDGGLGLLLSEFLLPLLITLGLLVGGAWLLYADIDGPYALHVGFWSLLGLNVMLTGSALALLTLGGGAPVEHPYPILFDYITGGAAGGFALGIYDSTRRKKAARLAAANERITWLNQQLSVLNRILRHDIRNDANVIVGYADMIEDKHPDVADRTQVIRQRANDLVAVGNKAQNIEHLLGDESWDRDVVDVVPIIESAVEQLQTDHSDLTVRTDLPETARVHALPLVTTAIESLLENAVEHNDSASPRIDVDVQFRTADGCDWIDIRVADNGPGLPPEEVAVLKQDHETPLHHASGLGLWITKWTATASEGEIHFAENDPHGSIVTLRLERAE